MDIPLVLQRLRPNENWGPLAQTGASYSAFAEKWRGDSPAPTQQEMQAAWEQILSEQKKPKTVSRLVAEVLALPKADLDRLIAAVCAEYLRSNPGFARSQGINLDGDEPKRP